MIRSRPGAIRSLLFLFLAILLTLGGLPAAGFGGEALAADWAAYGQGPEHCGWVGEALGSVLLRRWASQTGSAVQGGPVVVGDTLFIGAEDHILRAIDVAGGEVRWTFSADDEIRTTPAVSDGSVFVIDFAGDVYSLRASDGLLLWRASLGDRSGASPVVAGGFLYAATARGSVQAFEAATGRLGWTFEAGAPVWSSPAADGGLVYAEDYAGGVHALDVRDGQQVWSRQTTGELRSSPALYEGRLFVASSGYENGGVSAFDAQTGEALWTTSISGNNLWSAPTVAPLADGRTLVLIGNLGWLYALDARDGTVVWRTRVAPVRYAGRDKYPTMMTPIAGLDHVYVGAHYAVDLPSAVYSFSLADGRLLWTSPLEGKIATPLAQSAGSVYFGSYDGKVYAYAPMRVFVDGAEVDFGDLSPMIRADRSLVPFRVLFEAVGAEVEWDQAKSQVTARRGDRVIRLTVGQTTAYVDGRPVTLEVPATVISGRTLVPLRFVGEALGQLEWDQRRLRVDISLP